VSWVEKAAADALEPERVCTALERLAVRWPADFPPLESVIEDFPAGRNALPALLSVSPVSAEKIIQDPATLLWLAQPEICMSERGPRRMERDLEDERPTGFDPEFRALRRVKNREMLRIALRDVARLSTLGQTTLEISGIANLCVREVTSAWLAELSRRWTAPVSEFCVIGMGKLGGEELNYSSDIDVIFLYGDDGAINPAFTYHEFFTRLAEKITASFAQASPAGPLFRIDIRLRPEGAAGPLVRSLESMENYYAGYGETWERMALIKARRVAGSDELFYEFAHRLQPFIYPRSLSPDTLDEIGAIKGRIERELLDEAEVRLNLKLGRGGIREIEFVTQALQLLHGARHAFLQERNTLKALRALRQLDFIDARDLEALSGAYRFLRDAEHRLQIAGEEQTHTLPEPGPALERLARSLGFSGEGEFDAALDQHRNTVRAIFEKFFQSRMEIAPQQRDLTFFAHRSAAEKELAELGKPGGAAHVSPRTRQLCVKLEPLLIDNLRNVADPDRALHGLVRFVERYGIRGLLFESLVTNPRLLDLLVRLFDASRFLTDIVLRRPQLIEETARTGTLGRSLDVAAHLDGLAHREESIPPHDWVRVYRRAQILRIALRDILGFAGIAQVQQEYTALAEACVRHLHAMLGLDEKLTVIAMGKFGGAELSYGCDLDVLFVGDDSASAAELMKSLTAQTAEGIVFPVDARLRPEGESGQLAASIDRYAQYFKSRAHLWEAQALTKSRPVAGPHQAAFAEWARAAWSDFAKRADPLPAIREMHARVVRERSGSDPLLAFKTGIGGLMELEFHAQALQMRHTIWEPNTIHALIALAAAGVITGDDANARSADYLFLRRCEAIIRREDNSAISSLPASPIAQHHLAIRAGFASRETFLDHYRATRDAVHAWCSRIV
jgi:[glutamine synthetase] adenylyltransferase / [glutamine synthetase]-adenylyl-L-tyrosine phosphorylase